MSGFTYMNQLKYLSDYILDRKEDEIMASAYSSLQKQYDLLKVKIAEYEGVVKMLTTTNQKMADDSKKTSEAYYQLRVDIASVGTFEYVKNIEGERKKVKDLEAIVASNTPPTDRTQELLKLITEHSLKNPPSTMRTSDVELYKAAQIKGYAKPKEKSGYPMIDDSEYGNPWISSSGMTTYGNYTASHNFQPSVYANPSVSTS